MVHFGEAIYPARAPGPWSSKNPPAVPIPTTQHSAWGALGTARCRSNCKKEALSTKGTGVQTGDGEGAERNSFLTQAFSPVAWPEE